MTYPIEQQDENVTRLLRIYSQELPDSKARLVHEDSRREVYMIRFECGGKPLIENFSVEEIEDSDREQSLRLRIRRFGPRV